MSIPIKGTFKKRPPLPPNPVKIAKNAQQEAIKVASEFDNLKEEIDIKIGEIEQRVIDTTTSLEKRTIEAINNVETQSNRIEEAISNIKDGEPGKDAEPIDKKEIIDAVLKEIPVGIDEKSIINKVLKSLPEKKGDLKIITEKIEIDPMSVIEKIMELPADKFKLKLDQIDGLDQTIQSFRSQLSRGYLHGGGDTLVAGSGINLTPNSNGTKTISTINNAIWGDITGTITNQTDLITYLGGNFLKLDQTIPQTTINMGRGTRVISGGNVTQNSNTSVDITAGSGVIYNSATLTETYVSWNAFTNYSINADIIAGTDATYIFIDSAGSVYTTTSDPIDGTLRDYIYLAKVAHRSGSQITNIRDFRLYGEEPLINLNELTYAIGSLNLSGNVISYYGSALQIQKSSGVAYRFEINSDVDRKNPSYVTDSALTPITFNYCQQKTGGGVLYTPSQTSIDPSHYDIGNSTLGTVAGGQYTTQRVYYFPRTNSIYVFYGRTLYNSIDAAVAGITSESFTLGTDFFDGAILRSYIVVKGNATNLSNGLQARFLETGKFSGTGNSGSSLFNLQAAYDNSVQPQLITSTSLGALQFQRGSAADTDNVLEILNGAGSTTASINGNGDITAHSFITSGGTSFQFVKGDGSLDSSIYLTGVQWGDITGTITNQTDLTTYISNAHVAYATNAGSANNASNANFATNAAHANTAGQADFAGAPLDNLGNFFFNGGYTLDAANLVLPNVQQLILGAANTVGMARTNTTISIIKNALTTNYLFDAFDSVTGNSFFSISNIGAVTANSFITSGGTSSQFVMGNGSLMNDAPSDGSTYGRKNGTWSVAGGSGLTNTETYFNFFSGQLTTYTP